MRVVPQHALLNRNPAFQIGRIVFNEITKGAILAALKLMRPWDAALTGHKAGDRVPMRFVRRSGEVVDTTITFDEDPRVEVVLVEKSGGTLTDDQRRFRDAWLGSLQKR